MTAAFDAAVQAAHAELIANGASPGSGIHSWRCEHPDLYGPCACVDEVARDVVTAAWPHVAEAIAQAIEARVYATLTDWPRPGNNGYRNAHLDGMRNGARIARHWRYDTEEEAS